MSVAAIAQIVTAVATVLYAVVLGVLYYMFLRLYQQTLNEMRKEHAATERPQVLVGTDNSRLPEVDLVIKNISRGTAKDLTFEFSDRIESSGGFVLSDLPYFERGIDFLGPGGEIRCYWDSLEDLIPMLKEKGIRDGVTVTIRHRDLNGKPYEDRWTFDPLLYEGNRDVRQTDMSDLVGAVGEISRKLDKAIG